MINYLIINQAKKRKHQGNINTSKLIIIVLKVLGILFVINLIVLFIIFIIYRIRYEQQNQIASYSLVCTYNESSYAYNIGYNKNNKIVNADIEGRVVEKDKNIKWIEDLDKFVFSYEITDSSELKEYIINIC